MTKVIMPISAVRQREPLFLYHLNVFILFLPYASIILFYPLMNPTEFMNAVTVILPSESTALPAAPESTALSATLESTTLPHTETQCACLAFEIPITNAAEGIAPG